MISYDDSKFWLNEGRLRGYPYLLKKKSQLEDELEVIDVQASGLASKASDDEYVPQKHKHPQGVNQLPLIEKRAEILDKIEYLNREIDKIEEWFSTLDDDAWQVITRHYVQGQTYRRIADSLLLSHTACRNIARKALLTLED